MNRTVTRTRVNNGTVSRGTLTRAQVSTLKTEITTQVMADIASIQKTEKAREDARADRRNRNRVLMLIVALAGMFTMVPLLKHFDPSLLPFAGPIGLVPDFGLTLYALIRKF